MSCKGSILYIADFILGEVEVSQVGEAVHGAEEHSFQLVLIQSQVMDRVVDVLWDSLIRWLVLTADGQPHIAFVSLNEPAVPVDHVGKVEEEQEGGDNKKDSGGGRSTLHDADEERGDAITIKEINVEAGRKVAFVGEREATKITGRNLERGEGSGLGVEKGVKASQCQSQLYGYHRD